MLDINDLTPQTHVLGVLLCDSSIVGQILAETSESDFTNLQYKAIYKTLKELFVADKPTDPTMVRSTVGNAYDTELTTLMNGYASSRNWRAYAKEMREQSKLCALSKIGQDIMFCRDLPLAQEYISKANELFCDRQDNRIIGVGQGLVDFFDRQESETEYISWGMPEMDRQLYTTRGEFVIIGGRPSTGKTTLSINFAAYMARDLKIGFFSLETSAEKIYDRFFTQAAKLNFKNVKKHTLNPLEKQTLLDKSGSLQKRNFEVIQASGMTVQDIAAISLSRKYDVIFIDYVQLIASRGHNRTEEVSRISIELHNFAQRNNVLVIGLAQLSRPEKSSDGKIPNMASLKESGQLEQDADAILLLFLENENKPSSDRMLQIAKNKEGKNHRFRMAFDGAHQKFSLIDGGEDDEMKQQGFEPTAEKTPFDKTGG